MNQNDEIDLSKVFYKIQRVFSNFKNKISYSLEVIRKRWLLFILAILVGIGLGRWWFNVTTPIYKTSMTLTSTFLSNEYCAGLIKNLELVQNENIELLAKKLNISNKVAQQIAGIEFSKFEKKFKEQEDFTSGINNADVIYQTRIQKERFADPAEYDSVSGLYVVTPETLLDAKQTLTIMHPLPRVGEISKDVDRDPHVSLLHSQ